MLICVISYRSRKILVAHDDDFITGLSLVSVSRKYAKEK